MGGLQKKKIKNILFAGSATKMGDNVRPAAKNQLLCNLLQKQQNEQDQSRTG